MALVEPIKKGGRYTKKEQEERRLAVFQMHFEEGKPATRIAQLLNVNRNTINEDIKFWFDQFENMPEALDVTSKIKRQIERMEIQRDRILGYLEESETINDKIRIEKLISDIDNKLERFFSKAFFGKKEDLPPYIKFDEKITEDTIKRFVLFIFNSSANKIAKNIFSEDAIKFMLVLNTQCNQIFAGRVFRQMLDLGLNFCIVKPTFEDNYHIRDKVRYDLEKFGLMRNYLPKEEVDKFKRKMKIKGEKTKHE